MEKENLLKGIGLGNWEYLAYTALLSLGSSTTGPLVRESGIPQSKIYSVLDTLMEKGLVSYTIKGKVKYFQAAAPEKVLALFRNLEKEIDQNLHSIMANPVGEQSVELYGGMKAIKAMLLMLVQDAKKKEPYYIFGTADVSKTKEIQDFYEWWGIRKYEAKLDECILLSLKDKEMTEKAATSKEMLEGLREKTRYIDALLPGNAAIFRDKVIIYNWRGTSSAILITSKDISKNYKDFFLSLWKIAKQ